MFLQHQDILALLSSPQGLLKQLDSQLVSIKRQVPYHSQLSHPPAVLLLNCLTYLKFHFVTP